MKIRFYLRDTRAKNPTAIFVLVQYKGKPVKVYIGESIDPRFWDSQKYRAKASPKFPTHPEFNMLLQHIETAIFRGYLDHKSRHNLAELPPVTVKKIIDAALNRNVTTTDLLSYFADFVLRTQRGQRIDPKSRAPIREAVGRGYATTLQHLREFAKQWGRRLDFDTIDLDFHRDFIGWLQNPPRSHSLNTVGINIQRIKAVLSEATETGANTHLAFKSRYFVKPTEEPDTIYLTDKELTELKSLDLSAEPRLANARDLFLIGAFTGLRFSDYSVLQPSNIVGEFIYITQKKTGGSVAIPVQNIRYILDAHGGPPRSISNAKLNKYLKEIGQRAPSLSADIAKTATKGGRKTRRSFKKWELLTTHTGRRSFATNAYLAGVPPAVIMAITGHKTEKAFLRYIRVTSADSARIFEYFTGAESAIKIPA